MEVDHWFKAKTTTCCHGNLELSQLHCDCDGRASVEWRAHQVCACVLQREVQTWRCPTPSPLHPHRRHTHTYVHTYIQTRDTAYGLLVVCACRHALVSTMPTRWTIHPGKILHDPCVALRLPSHTGEAHLEFHQHIKFKVKLTVYDNNVKVEGVMVPCVYTIISVVLYV